MQWEVWHSGSACVLVSAPTYYLRVTCPQSLFFPSHSALCLSEVLESYVARFRFRLASKADFIIGTYWTGSTPSMPTQQEKNKVAFSTAFNPCLYAPFNFRGFNFITLACGTQLCHRYHSYIGLMSAQLHRAFGSLLARGCC